MAGRQGFSDENFGSAPSKKQRGVFWGSLFENRENWGGRRGLNPRHSVPQTDALPAELLPPLFQSLPWGIHAVKDSLQPLLARRHTRCKLETLLRVKLFAGGF